MKTREILLHSIYSQNFINWINVSIFYNHCFRYKHIFELKKNSYTKDQIDALV